MLVYEVSICLTFNSYIGDSYAYRDAVERDSNRVQQYRDDNEAITPIQCASDESSTAES